MNGVEKFQHLLSFISRASHVNQGKFVQVTHMPPQVVNGLTPNIGNFPQNTDDNLVFGFI